MPLGLKFSQIQYEKTKKIMDIKSHVIIFQDQRVKFKNDFKQKLKMSVFWQVIPTDYNQGIPLSNEFHPLISKNTQYKKFE